VNIGHVESKRISEVLRFAMVHADASLDFAFMERINGALEDVIVLQNLARPLFSEGK